MILSAHFLNVLKDNLINPPIRKSLTILKGFKYVFKYVFETQNIIILQTAHEKYLVKKSGTVQNVPTVPRAAPL